MKNQLKAKIVDIVDGKLTEAEMEELADFFKIALIESFDQDDEHFFKGLAYEMSSSVKDLALMIIDFRRDLKSRIHPDITDLTQKYIPQTADQLEGIIETTEQAANKIMDNLEAMQVDCENMAAILSDLKGGKISLPAGDGSEIEPNSTEALAPLIQHLTTIIDANTAMIADSFVQMSFQDLTGQRIKRIMSLVSQMESRLQKMVVSFGIKVAEKERNPDISDTELAQAVAEKESELAGPQKTGCGLDQAGIDDLLANI
jgi:chemotaxis protein CheZ